MSLVRKGVLITGGRVASVGLNMLANILFARSLGPDGLGQVELFRSTATIVTVFAGLGMGQAAIFFLNNRKVPLATVVTNSVKFVFVFGILLAAGLCTAFLLMPRYFGTVPATAAVIFSLGAAALLGTSLLRPVLVAQLAARKMVAADLVAPVLMIAGAGVLVLSGWMSVAAALITGAVSFLGVLVLILAFLWREIDLALPFDWGLFRQYVVHGFKMAASNILYVFSLNVTVMLLRYLAPDRFDDVGLYTRAVAVCGLVSAIPMAMGQLLYAKWSGLGAQDRARQAEMALRINMAYGVVMVVGILLFGKYLIWLMYGAKFIPASAALIFLAPSFPLQAVFSVCYSLLVADGRPLVGGAILVGTVGIIAAVAFLAVPVMGFRGAALGAMCGDAFTAAACMIACAYLYRVRPLHCLLLCRSDVTHIVRALKG